MAATGNNFIDFVSELVYGDLGVGELGTLRPRQAPRTTSTGPATTSRTQCPQR